MVWPREDRVSQARDVSLDSTSFATSVSYGTATGYSSVTSGSRDLEIYPSGVTTAYINTTIDLSSGSTYTVMSANVLSNASALLLTDDNSTPSSNTAELRIVNASPGLGTVDVYVVSPGTNLSSVSPTISNFAFEGVRTTNRSLRVQLMRFISRRPMRKPRLSIVDLSLTAMDRSARW